VSEKKISSVAEKNADRGRGEEFFPSLERKEEEEDPLITRSEWKKEK